MRQGEGRILRTALPIKVYGLESVVEMRRTADKGVKVVGCVSATPDDVLVFHEGSKGILSAVNRINAINGEQYHIHVFFMPTREALYYTRKVRDVTSGRTNRFRVLSHLVIIAVPDRAWSDRAKREAYTEASRKNLSQSLWHAFPGI